MELAGLASPTSAVGADRWDALGGGIRAWLSCRFAAEIATVMGRPVRSVIK
ncbi:hypothetical protein BN2537_2917 [Streptomyces venezuelae]|nr:hypothetical protein BN2537_2917 [Streptomyces venezuelae]